MKSSLALTLALLALVPFVYAQNFTVELTPLSAVVLPDTGGTISYRVTVTNQETLPRTADVWVKSTLPNSSTKPGPGPTTQTFLGNQSLTWDREQTLLPASPVGYYTLHAYVGLYPNTIWTQATLECQKQVLMGGVEQAWVARYTGTGPYGGDQPRDLAVDAEGNVYVTGSSYSPETMTDYVTVKYDAAGNQLWVARYNGPVNSGDVATSLAVNQDGNVYVTGCSAGNGIYYDYATIKYNAAGQQLWVARHNGSGNGEDVALGIEVDSQGNVYVTGYCYEIGTEYDYATIKYNADGVQQWVARYNGYWNDIDVANSIALDAVGNIYVTGYSTNSGTSADYTIIKYDTSGVQQWIARYDGPANYIDVARSLAVDAGGNVYVTGFSNGIVAFADFATVKYDAFGIQQWVARYNGPGNSDDGAYSLVLDTASNVYVTGFSNGSGTSSDYATIKYNTAGQRQWVARYNGLENGGDGANSLAVDGNGNVFVTGTSLGSGTGSDYATIKYNAEGIQQWVVRYNGPGNGDDEAHSLVMDQNGAVYVTGRSLGAGTNYDCATLKYSQPDVANWQPVTAVSFGAPLPQECRLEPPSPNPFNLKTDVRYKIQDARKVSLKVYDTAGRLVSTLVNGWREAGTHEVTFDGSMLASGMYFVRMQAGEYAGVQKLVLLK